MPSKRWLHMRLNRDGAANAEWAIAITGNDIAVRFGKEAHSLDRRTIARNTWRRQDPRSEARRRILEQQEQGFEILGTCSFGPDGKIVDTEEDPSAEIPVHDEQTSGSNVTDADAYFEVRAESWQALYEVMEGAMARLSSHHDCRWSTREGLPTAVPVIDGWTPAFQHHTGLGEVRHAGALRRANGVGALLLLLTMRLIASERGAVEVKVFKADNSEIKSDLRKEAGLLATFESNLDLVTPAAEEAGLVPRRIRLDQVQADQTNYWF